MPDPSLKLSPVVHMVVVSSCRASGPVAVLGWGTARRFFFDFWCVKHATMVSLRRN